MTGEVTPRSGYGAQYKALLSDFVDVCNEVKRLCVTEPVIPIIDMVTDQGTICAVYKDMSVIPLESWLQKRGGKLPVDEAAELLLPLYNALTNIHLRSDIHRGISPYTVYIDKADNLYLWDFCMSAARTGGSELEAELFNGYSAPEQYTASGWQGAWTDVYGAAALFYRVVSGFVPPKSSLIGPGRPLSPLMDLVMDIPANISDAVERAMDIEPGSRTQDMGSFVASFVARGTEPSDTAVYDSSIANEIRRARMQKREQRAESRRRGKYVVLGMLVSLIAIAAAFYLIMTTYFPELTGMPGLEPATEESATPSEEVTTVPTAPDTEMPQLIGMTRDAVEAEYGERFELQIQEDYNEQYGIGEVYDQSPSDGVTIAEGRTVIVYVSRGPLRVVMPDLIGRTKEEARHAMQDLTEKEDFEVPYTEIDKFFADADPGTVVETIPAAGDEFDPQDTRVTIFYMLEEPEPVTGPEDEDEDGLPDGPPVERVPEDDDRNNDDRDQDRNPSDGYGRGDR
jgi:serine/threonine-protein kinase